MNNLKFNADAAEQHITDLLVKYRKTKDEIFTKDNRNRDNASLVYTTQYYKYFGMEEALREVLEYFAKFDF